MAKTLAEHQSQDRVRLMVVGDSSSGKTGALAGLANAGMGLWIADFDDGLDVLRHLVKPEFHKNIVFETFRDKVRLNPNGPYVPGTPEAFARSITFLERAIKDAGPNDIIVIDTLTHMGAAAMNWVIHLAKRWGKKKRWNDWDNAMTRQEAVIQELTGPDVRANVVVNAHLTLISTDEGRDDDEEEGASADAAPKAPTSRPTIDFKRYPSALGRKLPPRIPTYFNAVVQTKVVGAGPRAKRVIRTVPEPDVDVKVPVLPGVLPAELPIEDGLLRIFNAIKGQK